jgi:hypothetical protein
MNFLTELADFAGPVVVSRDLTYGAKTKTFYFRELSAAASEDLFLDRPVGTSNKGFRASVVAAVMCDAEGKDVLTVAQAAVLKNALSNLLMNTCLDVNGMTAEAKEEAGNVQ